MALNSRMRCRRTLSSSVVCVRSPVKTTKSGCCGSAFTAFTACFNVFSASGFGGALKPQCVSLSWTKKKSSLSLRRCMVAQPASPDANTAPPRPSNCRNSRRVFGSFMLPPAARLGGAPAYSRCCVEGRRACDQRGDDRHRNQRRHFEHFCQHHLRTDEDEDEREGRLDRAEALQP